jgi:hypothetical protein
MVTITDYEKETIELLELKKEVIKDRCVVLAGIGPRSREYKVVPGEATSRYFPEGRRRIKGRIFGRLGPYGSTNGILLTLTFDPKKISRADAWANIGKEKSRFMNHVNVWRRRKGWVKAKYLSVVEYQKGTGYPHIHMVFPKLRYLAELDVLTAIWGQADNSVDISPEHGLGYKDNFHVAGYICKYISKMDNWDILGMAYMWLNQTRLYHLSTDYTVHVDKYVCADYIFNKAVNSIQAIYFMHRVEKCKLNNYGGLN